MLGSFGVIVKKLHPGKRILRGRINEKPGEYDHVSKVSYKPQEYNKTYMRASTPKQTMFYGSIVPEIRSKKEPDTARATILYEISEFARDPESVGEQTVTYSVWEVQEDIELLSLMHYKEFERPTELSKKLQTEFEDFIKKHPEKKESTSDIVEFLGEQYAKMVSPDEDYNYLISACHSEIVSEFGLDGVLYPSVKLAGEGINVAIKPDSVKKLKLVHVGECTLYKNKKESIMGNDTDAEINKDGSLKYKQAREGVFVPKEYGRKQVGL
jgi:hypothetical protein